VEKVLDPLAVRSGLRGSLFSLVRPSFGGGGFIWSVPLAVPATSVYHRVVIERDLETSRAESFAIWEVQGATTSRAVRLANISPDSQGNEDRIPGGHDYPFMAWDITGDRPVRYVAAP